MPHFLAKGIAAEINFQILGEHVCLNSRLSKSVF